MQTQSPKYKLIFAVAEEGSLGILIEPYAVKLTENGQLSYSFTRINSVTHYDYFTQGTLDENELEAIRYADLYQKQSIIKKYNKNKRVKSLEFIKELNKNPNKEHIRNYIERYLVKCLDLITQKGLPLHYKGDTKDAISDNAVTIYQKPAQVVFNFEKTETETHYYLSIKQHDKDISLKGKHNLLITNKPCYLFLNNQLFKFEENFDSKKLKPFLTKDFVNIPKSYEQNYYETFIHKAIQRFTVKAKGFEISTPEPKKRAVLKLESNWNNEPVFVLLFHYNKHEVLMHKSKEILVEFLKKNGSFAYEKIYRDYKWETHVKNELQKLGILHKEESTFTIKKNKEKGLTFSEKKYNLIHFVNENYKLINDLQIEVQQNIEEQDYFTGEIKMDFKIQENVDWFDIQIYIKFDEYKIPFIQLRHHLKNHKRDFRLPNGKIAVLPVEWFAKYEDILNFNISDDQNSLKINKHHYTLINKIKEAKSLKGLKKLSKINKIKSPEVPQKLHATLRPYQQKGFSWLYSLQKNRLGGCLADDMGLGKTLQTLTVLLKLRLDSSKNNGIYTTHQAENPTQLNLFDSNNLDDTKKTHHTSLIVMPLSLIYNWEEEIKRFAPVLKIGKHIGSFRKSATAYFKYYDVVLTTYGVVRNDIDFLRSFHFEYIILDESQIIKNPESKIYQCVKKLKSNFKLVLTGTPIENSLIDLWSQMNFLNPGILGNLSFFKNEFVTPIEKQNNKEKQKKLQEIIEPYILRRTKETVAKDLPPLTEKIYYCEMTDEQKSRYEEKKSEIRNYIIENVSKYGTNKSRFVILKGLMQLRLLSNHPNLLLKDKSHDSGKYEEVIRNIESLVAENHKVLIFSQFVKHLKIFEDYFNEQKFSYSKITGSMNEKVRKEMINKFQNENENRLFLISLKAGGVGLNLTAADYVFLLDPWWNPAAESQAINRAHRIGQHKNVIAYKFITKESIEEKIYLLQQRKSALAEKFINNNNPLKYFSNAEIYHLLQ